MPNINIKKLQVKSVLIIIDNNGLKWHLARRGNYRQVKKKVEIWPKRQKRRPLTFANEELPIFCKTEVWKSVN